MHDIGNCHGFASISQPGDQRVLKLSLPIGRPSELRNVNAQRVLRLLRDAGSCSRADLTRASGLSAPTITNIVNDLRAGGLIEDVGEGESSGGRPPDLIRFHARHACLLAMEITTSGLAFLLTDLDGETIGTTQQAFIPGRTSPAEVCAQVADCVRDLLRANRRKRSDLLILVVSVPAITDVEQGVVVSISSLQDWRAVPLREMLARYIPCTILLENDMNLAALGERYKGAAQGVRDFVLITIGQNAGAGLMLNGAIHHGCRWSAGEIAYLRLPNVARRGLKVHEFGEIEEIVTVRGLEKQWLEAKSKDGQKAGRSALPAESILALALAGDERAAEIVAHSAAIIVDVIVNLSVILNPALVVLGGTIGSHPAILAAVESQLAGSEFAVPGVVPEALGSANVLYGGIASASDVLPELLVDRLAGNGAKSQAARTAEKRAAKKRRDG
jgi:glucokinase